MKKNEQTKKKPEFSSNKKLEKVLKEIKYELLHMCNTKKESLESIEHYYKNFKREPDYNIAQYGNLTIYYGDIRKMYKKAGYGSTIDRMSDNQLWETYKRQVGYVVRELLKK